TLTPAATFLASGNSTIISNQGSGGPAALTFNGAFTRATGATGAFQAGATSNQTFNTTSNVINFTTVASATSGIIPGVFVSDASTLNPGPNAVTSTFKYANNTTFGAGTLQAIVAQTSYATTPTYTATDATTNFLFTTSQTLTAADAMNSLLIVGDGVTISGNALIVPNI